MTTSSTPRLLVLHSVRILGFADTRAVARRFSLDAAETEETLLDDEARGWVGRSSFLDLTGWSLTTSGRTENERLLAAELDGADARRTVEDVHRAFLPLNARVQQACTDWQLRPTTTDRLAPNDHVDAAWDAAVLDELDAVGLALGPLVAGLEAALARFGGYDTRFGAALVRARAGDPGWVDRTDVDSCHRVWFELHEDLVASLGLDRGSAR